MKKHTYPKSTDVKGEVRSAPQDVPDDDLEVTAGKKDFVVRELHPRCGIDRDDAECRDEMIAVEP
jgi:uncharacterized protein YjbJ (UPF0337 family)